MSCTSALVRDVNKQCREIVERFVAERSEAPTDKKWLLCNTDVATRLQGKQPR